jgi:hypothetical protein
VVFNKGIGDVSEEEPKGIENTDDIALSELDAVEVTTFEEVPKWTRAAV